MVTTDENSTLCKAMLPRARVEEKAHREVASLVETRDRIVKLRTVLLNKIHGLLNAQGIKLKKESLSSQKGLQRVLSYEIEVVSKVEVEIIVEQIQQLNKSIARLEEVIQEQAKS